MCQASCAVFYSDTRVHGAVFCSDTKVLKYIDISVSFKCPICMKIQFIFSLPLVVAEIELCLRHPARYFIHTQNCANLIDITISFKIPICIKT